MGGWVPQRVVEAQAPAPPPPEPVAAPEAGAKNDAEKARLARIAAVRGARPLLADNTLGGTDKLGPV